MTPNEHLILAAAVEDAVPAWCAAYKVATGLRGSRRGFDGETADEILKRHGITFRHTPKLYFAAERAIRRRGSALLEAGYVPPEPTPKPRPARPERPGRGRPYWWTVERAVDFVRSVGERLGRTPTYVDLYPHATSIIRQCGSLTEAQRLAGFRPNAWGGRRDLRREAVAP